MIQKEELEKIYQIKGKVRGVVFITDKEYVEIRFGKDAIKKVEKRLEELGYPIEYEKIKPMEWYPWGLRAISLIAIAETFNFKKEDIFDMGNNAPKYSFIIKLLIRFFLSFDKLFKKSPLYWKKHHTIGKLEPIEVDMKKKEAIIRLYGLKAHPLFCEYLRGYFARVSQFGLKTKKIKIEETKCMFKGDDYHEYKITWE